MSIQIVNDQVSRPQVFCDHCQQRIKRAEDGNYQWRAGFGKGPFPISFTHKECFEDFLKANPETEEWGWAAEELTLLPYYLENNLDIDHDEVLRSEGRL